MIITIDEVKAELIMQADVITDKRGNRNGAPKKCYLDLITCFDIETSKVVTGYKDGKAEYQSFMYIWQFQLGPYTTIIGRTWEEFDKFVNFLIMNLPDKVNLVCYVHNLSYEFQFLSGVYRFKSNEVFAVKSRKILKAVLKERIEFRCSYLLTNMNLDRFLKQMGVEVQKKIGQLDYDIVRYPWTELKDSELDYCVSDVQGLYQGLEKMMEKDGDNLITIPLTSTGYVRRDCKKAMRSYPFKDLQMTLPPFELFELLVEEFRGGDTHANRYYIAEKMTDVVSYDKSSAYPAYQVLYDFPVGKWKKKENPSLDMLIDLEEKGNALIFRISLYNVRLRDKHFPDPYISISKCNEIYNRTNDNGRVLDAEYLNITLNDLDFMIISEIYDWDSCVITDLYYCKYGVLPAPLLEQVKEYFNRKTSLKGNEQEEYYYMKSKNKLNSIYGMTAQNPVRENIFFNGVDYKVEKLTREERKKRYNKSLRKAFLSYAWACWTTAGERTELYKGIKLAYETECIPIYWDTDSVKCKYTPDLSKLNNDIMRRAKEKNGYAADMNGKTHYLGVWEKDGEYEEFKTLGAKKYVYRKGGKLYTTIAGVVKAKGGEELEKYGGIDAFAEGFIFNDAGGKDIIYNDTNYGIYKTDDGHEIEITRNAVIKDSTYELGIAGEFRRLLEGLQVI